MHFLVVCQLNCSVEYFLAAVVTMPECVEVLASLPLRSLQTIHSCILYTVLDLSKHTPTQTAQNSPDYILLPLTYIHSLAAVTMPVYEAPFTTIHSCTVLHQQYFVSSWLTAYVCTPTQTAHNSLGTHMIRFYSLISSVQMRQFTRIA